MEGVFAQLMNWKTLPTPLKSTELTKQSALAAISNQGTSDNKA